MKAMAKVNRLIRLAFAAVDGLGSHLVRDVLPLLQGVDCDAFVQALCHDHALAQIVPEAGREWSPALVVDFVFVRAEKHAALPQGFAGAAGAPAELIEGLPECMAAEFLLQ